MEQTKQQSQLTTYKITALAILIGFTGWWIFINYILQNPDHDSVQNQLFSATYGVAALIGGLVGLRVAKRWGGLKSLIGRSLFFFSLGLLAQEFGQIAYSVSYVLLDGEVPYPSIGDIGYFGSVLLYIYASTQLAKSLGIRLSLKKASKKLVALIVPLALLGLSYVLFLKGYEFDFSSLTNTLTVFLDFGYPIGQAIYVAIAVLTYLFSAKLLGGIMKNKILLVLLALVIQYIADSTFLYANIRGSFYGGGANDYVYLLSYLMMGYALSSFLVSPAAQGANKIAANEVNPNV